MPLIDAHNFIRKAIENKELRNQLNGAASRVDLFTILKSFTYEFSLDDFDDAYRGLLVKCQSEEQASVVKEIKSWWDFLLMIKR
jgi:hypothetical protein